jgi:DNA-binding response OmpR family regulator
MKRILIVEDDPSIAELEKDYLDVAGFQVSICPDGSRALELIRKNDYDLLIIDIMLPGLDGLEILRRIRDEKNIPVLLVSAKKEEIDKIKGFSLVQAGVEKYDTNVISIRGLKIEKDARRVYLNDCEVNLAHKEFDLLIFLVENPNRVFGREELFEKVWGMDALGDSATVTVHIARIRDKNEPNPATPQYVETVWGAGYRFRV